MMEQSNVPSRRPAEPSRPFGQQPDVGPGVKDNYWPGTTMAVGILVLLVSFWSVGQLTFIGFLTLSKVFATLAVIGNLLPYAWSGLRLGMEKLEWLLFNVLAVGPLVLSALLWVNYAITGEERDYAVYLRPRYSVVAHWRATGELPRNVELDFAHLPYDEVVRLAKDSKAAGHLVVARGCLGYDVVKHWGPMDL
jgi:hypothetical protein